MTSARRWLLPLVTLLVVLLGWAPPASAAEEGPADDAATVERVLVVGVPGLVWNDVDATTTPNLWGMADRGSIGALSVRAARGTTCLLDGWATLGAGNRARYPGPVEPIPPVSAPSEPLPDAGGATPAPPGGTPTAPVDTRLSYCGLEEQVAKVGLAEPERTVTRVAEDEATARFGAEPGALGQAVSCSTVVGRAAALAVAGEGAVVTVTDQLPG